MLYSLQNGRSLDLAVWVVAQKAQSEFDESADTGIDEAVEDAVALAAGGHDLLIGHALQMVRHRLRARFDLTGNGRNRCFARSSNGVQDAQSCVAGKHSKEGRELVDLWRGNQRSLGEGFWDEFGGG